MLKSAVRLLLSLLLWVTPAGAEDAQVLPDAGKAPPVDMITPVPPPEIPLGGPGLLQPEMPKELKITNEGGTIEGNVDTGVRLGGPVKIEGDNGLQVFSNTALLDLKAKTVTLEGNVVVYQGNLMQRGDRAVYYYERKFLDASGLRASLDPILLEAWKFTAEQRGNQQVYVGENAGITTHDVEHPNYWVRAKKTTVYPNDKVVFNDLKVYAGDRPVFWLPYLSQPLNAELGYHFVPGARSSWGGYLLNTYGMMLGGKTDPVTGEDHKDAWLLSRWHLDLRSKRGAGLGLDLQDTRLEDRKEFSGLGLYYLHDLAPDTSRSGVPRDSVDPERYRVTLKHRYTPSSPDGADWRVDANLTKLSDAYYLEDFDQSLYRIDPSPDNTLAVYRRDDESLLSLLARFRLNDFYRADTRSPEIAYDQARGPWFGLPLLHEGRTSLGVIGEQAADNVASTVFDELLALPPGDPSTESLLRQLNAYERVLAEQMLALPPGDDRREAIRTQLLDSSYARFSTYHEWSLPLTLGNFLTVVPQAGGGYTRYEAMNGPISSMDHTYLHAGVETSLKFSRDLDGSPNPAWGLDGLKHIIQPYALWSVVAADDLEAGDPMVDRLTPTTRPRPLDPVRYTAIDQLQSWNVVRLGTRNRLLTRRDGQSFEWLYLDTYMDAFINDPEDKREFSNLYNDVRWQPVPWLGVSVETQFPIVSGGSGFNEFNTRVHYMPTDYFSCSVGYRWLNNHPILTSSDRFDLHTYTRVTESWGLATHHIIELDDNTLEYQQYTVHRDLGNWIAGVGLTMRDNRLEKEYGLVLSLTLKDFPSVSLPFEIDAQ